MATPVHCLIIEDHRGWQDELRRCLTELGGEVLVATAASARAARSLLDRRQQDPFDLATIDLSLLALRSDGSTDESGLRLAEDFFRQSPGTALLVVTGNSTPASTRKLLLDRVSRVFDVVEKDRFRPASFVRLARKAILDSRLRLAAERAAGRYHMAVAFGRESWLGSELHGPDLRSSYHPEQPIRFAAGELARRADQINILLRAGPQTWRREVDALGEATAAAFQADRRIADDFIRAKIKSSSQNPLWLELSGPPGGLGIPFELIWDEGDRLCLKHLLTRRLIHEAASPSRRTDSFRRFVEKLAERGKPLRALLVGADGEGAQKLPQVRKEIKTLTAEIEIESSRLGLKPQIESLLGLDASGQAIREALERGEYHLFHYAGHGYFSERLPELSGLFLRDGEYLRATDLHLSTDGAPLQLAFLSCCLSGRTAADAAYGDFQGVIDGLAQADVPSILGYRWTVGDEAAAKLALAFYRALWRTLSPAQALLAARRDSGMGAHGRNDSAWASPILICQND